MSSRAWTTRHLDNPVSRALFAPKCGDVASDRPGRIGEKLTILDLSGALAGPKSAGRRKLEDRFVHFYAELRIPVSCYLRHIGLGPEEAEEIVQEVFLRLFIHLLGQGGEENLRGWIYRVAQNLAIDRLKERRCLISRSPQEWAGLSGLLQDQAPDPEQLLIGQERIARIDRAIRSLRPRQWQCLRLRMEGFRCREIGELLGMRMAAVAQSLHRAIQKLRGTEMTEPGER